MRISALRDWGPKRNPLRTWHGVTLPYRTKGVRRAKVGTRQQITEGAGNRRAHGLPIL